MPCECIDCTRLRCARGLVLQGRLLRTRLFESVGTGVIRFDVQHALVNEDGDSPEPSGGGAGPPVGRGGRAARARARSQTTFAWQSNLGMESSSGRTMPGGKREARQLLLCKLPSCFGR
jgi:hypothetical protein